MVHFTLLLTCGLDLRSKPCGANFLRPNPIANLRQKTCRNAAGRARGHYGAGSALQEPHTARPNQSSVGMASTNPRGGSMGLQGPPYAVLSPLVTDPLAPPGDPESSLFLTCHFVRKARRVQNRRIGQNAYGLYSTVVGAYRRALLPYSSLVV